MLFSLYFTTTSSAIPMPEIMMNSSSGLTIGHAMEFVYRDDKILSELEWPMHPLVSFGIGTDLRWKNGFMISTSLVTGIPGRSGTFKDSDFMNQPVSAVKTHYSEHEGYVEHALDTKLVIGGKIITQCNGPGTNRKIGFHPTVGFRYLLYKWAGKNGFYQYGALLPSGYYAEWNKNIVKNPLYGTGISYQQEYWMPVFGGSLSIPVRDTITVNLSVEGSPAVWCIGTDNHFKLVGTTRPDEFYDSLSDGYLIEPALSTKWGVSEHTNLFITGQWTYIAGLRGDTYERYTNTDTVATAKESAGSGGGAAFNTFSLRLGVEAKLR